MLDNALTSIRMIKLAHRVPMVKQARTTPFYWRSFLDPDADAFDATRQELMDSFDRLMKNYNAATDTVTINGVNIPRGAIGHLYDAAWVNNNALAAQRRRHGGGIVAGGLATGAVGGGLLGHWGGKKITGWLGGSENAQKWGGRIGAVLGGLLGLGVGGHIATRYKENHMPHTLGNGSTILRDLNTSLGNLYTARSGGRKHLTGDDANINDTSKPDTAKARKLGTA